MYKHELKNLVSGISKTKQKNLIQTIAGILRTGKEASRKPETAKLTKHEETELILNYIRINGSQEIDINESNYLACGAEQKVYLNNDGTAVIKINSGIFYYNWSDYLTSLIIHNFFFPETSYTLLGFLNSGNMLSAVVQQPYIISTAVTDLNNVKALMINNGFRLKKITIITMNQ